MRKWMFVFACLYLALAWRRSRLIVLPDGRKIVKASAKTSAYWRKVYDDGNRPT
jgi:hypothetical protein